MPGKSRETDVNLERMLEAVLELIGWQAELVRAALRKAREHSAGGQPGSKSKAEGPGSGTIGKSG
jgi:hypothetical protein